MIKNKGITLVSLIITIIVLLILAGVVISGIVFSNGIIGKAKNVAERYNESAGKEANTINSILGLENEIKTNIINEDIYYPGINVIFEATAGLQYAKLNGNIIDNNTIISDTGTYTLEVEDRKGNKITRKFYVNDGLLALLKSKFLEDGVQTVSVNGVDYSIEVINFNEDISYSETPVLGNETPDNNLLVLRYHGNLTINKDVILTSQVRKKAMVVIVEGNLINNGTISMTARGAKAEGQNVYLWKNENAEYETIPAVGANGGARASAPVKTSSSAGPWYVGKIKGNNGENATGRALGGGASGGSSKLGSTYNGGRGYSGAGTAATSYSGGSGGGALYYHMGSTNNTVNGYNGVANGGAGGQGYVYESSGYTGYAAGGAGNNGGLGKAFNGSRVVNYPAGNGKDGTGGLILIYAYQIENNGEINAKGSDGGSSQRIAGGASGGGSINIFYKDNLEKGTINVDGGKGGTGAVAGGDGGSGSIIIGKIREGSFVETP